MTVLTLDAEAGQVSAELALRGIDAATRVHVTVDVLDDNGPPLAALNQDGGAFDWLEDEPDLYSDADVIARLR